MTEYPMIQKVLHQCDSYPASQYVYLSEALAKSALATELRALLAERDALKAKVPPPVRKLREHKGVTYEEQYPANSYWRYKGEGWPSASALIAQWDATFTDADHAPIYALRDDPYKPVETVEDIVRDVVRCGTMDFIDSYATRLRAAVAAEGVRDA